MKILLDTDILVDVALDRRPFSEPASALLDKLEQKPGTGFIAWHSASNLFYLVSSVSQSKDALQFIRELLGFIEIAHVGTPDMVFALSLEMPDFEDALQSAAAVACKAEWIVTRNLRHYKNSPVRAISPGDLLLKHI